MVVGLGVRAIAVVEFCIQSVVIRECVILLNGQVCGAFSFEHNIHTFIVIFAI